MSKVMERLRWLTISVAIGTKTVASLLNFRTASHRFQQPNKVYFMAPASRRARRVALVCKRLGIEYSFRGPVRLEKRYVK